jgi:DNA-binding SARP family transcriptional activator/WD40 repeat protein
VQVSVLGPVAVIGDGGEVPLGPRQERLLAALAAAAGSVVSVDRLVDIIWAGEPPLAAETSVKTYVTRLRHTLRPAARKATQRDPDGDVITFRRPGYWLDLGVVELDSRGFERELAEARGLVRVADDEAAAGLLEVALGRWRGRAYGELADEDWCRPECVRLEELRIEARELWIEAVSGLGRHDEAVAAARALVEEHPTRERPRELLMRAFHASGRQAEALRVVPEFRRVLVEELGLDVSAELAELESRIARRDPALVGSTRALHGYELGERIGVGTFSVVHRAVQPGVEREVAVKIIRAELADQPDFVRRFEHEARLVARLEHPNIVPIHDFWREPGAAFLVMRLVRGGTAAQWLARYGPFSRRLLLDLVEQVGNALEYAHRRDVVHRDVRPANILLDDDGNAYLSDFGIARPAQARWDGDFVTPAYSAPEALRGQPVGPPADVLSLGVTVFELLTGRLPFAAASDRAELVQHQMFDPLPPSSSIRTDLPAAVDEVLATATAKSPDDRHATVTAFVGELRRALEDGVGGRRPIDVELRTTPAQNPYVGLHAFDEADADVFFGRESVVAELADALRASRFVALVGASGSGKSSIVRAGLVPALRRGAVPGSERWFITTFSVGYEPFEALETALLRVAVNPPATLREQLGEPGGLLRAVRRILPHDDAVVLMVIDQFEEVFAQVHDLDVQHRFLRELAAALDAPRSPLRVVVTVRADYFDALLRHPAIAEHVARRTVAVRPMSPTELETAIVRPAASMGVTVESALAAELVAAVSDRPTALPLLQFALTEVFERRVADVMLATTFHELGGLVGALTARAERVVLDHSDDGESVARQVFGRLVHVDDLGADTRRRVLRRELEGDSSTSWLVDALVAARLLAVDRDPSTREPTVEVAHEALLRDWPRLRRWLDEDRGDLRMARIVSAGATAWVNGRRDPADLARAGRLEAALDVAGRRPELLSAEEHEWVDESARAASAEDDARRAAAERDRRQNRRLRVALGTAAAFLMLALVAAGVALIQRGRALDGETAAEAAFDDAELGRLVALSAAQLDVDSDRAILLAVEANRRQDDAVTQGAVLGALASEPRISASYPNPLTAEAVVRFSADGATGVTWSLDPSIGEVEVFDVETGRSLLSIAEPDIGVDSAALSGDGSVVGTVHGASQVEVRPVSASAGADHRIEPDHEVWEIAFDGDGSVVATGGGSFVTVHDVARGVVLLTVDIVAETGRDDHTIPPLTEPGALALSRDATRIAVSVGNWLFDEDESGVDVFDVATGELLHRYRGSFGGTHIVAISPDGSKVAAVGDTPQGRNQVVVIDVDAGSVRTIGGYEALDVRVAVGDDGSLTSASVDGIIRFLDAEGAVRAPSVRTPYDLDAVATSGSGGVVAGAYGGGHLIVHETESILIDRTIAVDGRTRVPPTGTVMTELDADRSSLRISSLDSSESVPTHVVDFGDMLPGGVFFWRESNDANWVLAAGQDEALAVAEVAGERRHVISMAPLYREVLGEPFDPASSPIVPRVADGGERIFVRLSSRSGGVAAVWIDPADGSVLEGPLPLESPHGPALVLPDGRVMSGSAGMRTHVLAADLSEASVVADDLFATPLAHDPISGHVLVGGGNGLVALVDPDSGEARHLESIRGFVTDGAFSPDGRRVAARAVGSGIHLFDVESGRVIGSPVPTGDDGLQAGMAWSDDGLWFVTAQGVVRMVTDPEQWVSIGCALTGRVLTDDEWRTFVSDTAPPRDPCAEARQVN